MIYFIAYICCFFFILFFGGYCLYLYKINKESPRYKDIFECEKYNKMPPILAFGFLITKDNLLFYSVLSPIAIIALLFYLPIGYYFYFLEMYKDKRILDMKLKMSEFKTFCEDYNKDGTYTEQELYSIFKKITK